MESSLDRSQEGQVQALALMLEIYDSGPQFSHVMSKLGQLMFWVLTLPEMMTIKKKKKKEPLAGVTSQARLSCTLLLDSGV